MQTIYRVFSEHTHMCWWSGKPRIDLLNYARHTDCLIHRSYDAGGRGFCVYIYWLLQCSPARRWFCENSLINHSQAARGERDAQHSKAVCRSCSYNYTEYILQNPTAQWSSDRSDSNYTQMWIGRQKQKWSLVVLTHLRFCFFKTEARTKTPVAIMPRIHMC